MADSQGLECPQTLDEFRERVERFVREGLDEIKRRVEAGEHSFYLELLLDRSAVWYSNGPDRVELSWFQKLMYDITRYERIGLPEYVAFADFLTIPLPGGRVLFGVRHLDNVVEEHIMVYRLTVA